MCVFIVYFILYFCVYIFPLYICFCLYMYMHLMIFSYGKDSSISRYCFKSKPFWYCLIWDFMARFHHLYLHCNCLMLYHYQCYYSCISFLFILLYQIKYFKFKFKFLNISALNTNFWRISAKFSDKPQISVIRKERKQARIEKKWQGCLLEGGQPTD